MKKASPAPPTETRSSTPRTREVLRRIGGPAKSRASDEFAALQHTVGNRVVTRLLAERSHAPAEPLPPALRESMEHGFGAALGAVRVHRDSSAAVALGARAFASGADLHFAPGELDTATLAGRELIGHEIAHTIQQAQGRVSGPQGAGGVLAADAGLESEADAWGRTVARGAVAVDSGVTVPRAGNAAVQGKFYTDKRGEEASDKEVDLARARFSGQRVLAEFDRRRYATTWYKLQAFDSSVVGSVLEDEDPIPSVDSEPERVETNNNNNNNQRNDDNRTKSDDDAGPEEQRSKKGRGRREPAKRKQASAPDLRRRLEESDDSGTETTLGESKVQERVDAIIAEAIRTSKEEAKLNRDSELQDLSRLAFLIDAVCSAAVCVAVLKSGHTLYVSGNKLGEAAAKNAYHLFGALQSNALDKPFEAQRAEGIEFQFGTRLITPPPEEKKLSNEESTLDKVKRGYLKDVARGKKDQKTFGEQATTHSKRRLRKAAAWLPNSGIKQVIIHKGSQHSGEKHAEMRLLDAINDSLANDHKLDAPIVIGISKICCGLCYLGVQFFKELHAERGVTLKVQGAHFRTYQKWPVPRFVRARWQEFVNFGKKFEAADKNLVLHALSQVKVRDTKASKKRKAEDAKIEATTQYYSDQEPVESDEPPPKKKKRSGRAPEGKANPPRKRSRDPEQD